MCSGVKMIKARQEMTQRRQSSFYPVSEFDDKSNYKRFVRIERDGSLVERVFLNVLDPSERERLICLHYLRHITRHFLKEDVGVYILGRDNPWDFSLELSTGSIFYLEITSIADMPKHFEINKSEERLDKWRSEVFIPLHELEKLSRLFPDRRVVKLVSIYKDSGNSDGDLVDNPFVEEGKRIFVSNMPETSARLEELIKSAIIKKELKRHLNKEKTVLVIDNRTSLFEISDYVQAAESLSEYCDSLPFPEIWFYTGYCSDSDGNNAEFSFAPLKLNDKQIMDWERIFSCKKVDKDGKVVW